METTKTMKRKSLLAILVCCFALCVAMTLAGCGDSKADYSKNFTGDWEISSMVDAEEDIDADTLDFMKAMAQLHAYAQGGQDGVHRLVRGGFGRYLGAQERIRMLGYP